MLWLQDLAILLELLLLTQFISRPGGIDRQLCQRLLQFPAGIVNAEADHAFGTKHLFLLWFVRQITSKSGQFAFRLLISCIETGTELAGAT